jgi:hypothetical protein
LQEVIDLYMKSNPDFDKKTKAAASISQDDVDRAVRGSLRQVQQFLCIIGLFHESEHYFEGTDE